MICSKSAVDFIRRASGILKVSGSNKSPFCCLIEPCQKPDNEREQSFYKGLRSISMKHTVKGRWVNFLVDIS